MTLLGQYKGNPRDALGYLNAVAAIDPTQTFHRRNLPRLPLDDKADALTTAVMTSVPIWLNAGDVVTNLTFVSGATAAGTPANWWFALYSTAAVPALLAQTADQTTGAWAADTAKTLPLSAPVTIAYAGIYRAAIMVKATTVCSLVGTVAALPVVTGDVAVGQSSGTALTATAPATIATPTAQRAVPYVVAT